METTDANLSAAHSTEPARSTNPVAPIGQASLASQSNPSSPASAPTAPTAPAPSGSVANDIRICDKCRHIKVKTMVSKLQKAAPDTEVKVGCKSYCGPCSRYAFIFVNGRYVTAPTEDEAIEKARRFIK